MSDTINLKEENIEEENIEEESINGYNNHILFGCCCLCIPMIILIFSIPSLDLYYGFNDSSCVVNDTGKFIINLKEYLLVSGFIVIIYLILLTLFIIYASSSSYFRLGNIEAWNEILKIIILNHIINAFLLIWNILGGVLFWNIIDTNNCSENIYNYIFVTLILKFFINFLIILQIKN